MNTKFKAWVESYNEMFDVAILDLRKKTPFVQLHGFKDRIFTTTELDIIQYTGFTDLNEKEIWEGDIVELHNPKETPVGHIAIVTISTKYGPMISRHPIHVKRNPEGGASRHLSDFINIDEEDNLICRVIGNVFQNPEYDLILFAEKMYNNLQYSEGDMKIN